MKNSFIFILALFISACSSPSKKVKITFDDEQPAAVTEEDANPADLEFELAEDNLRTTQMRDLILSAVKKYNLKPYISTRKIRIERGAMSHSHPILTINTEYVDDEGKAVADFIHEQMHWYGSSDEEALDRLIARYKKMYPKPQLKQPQGSGTLSSTLNHITVCWMELQVLKKVFGDPRGYEIFKSFDHYTWVRSVVLKDEKRLGALIRAEKFDLL